MIKYSYLFHYVLFLLIVVSTLSCGTTSSNNKKNEKNATAILEKTAITFLNEEQIEIADLKGKPVFLNFWATWCGPCIKEMPDMEKAYKVLKKEDFEFIAVSSEGINLIKRFTKDKPYTFSFGKVKESVMYDLGIRSIPTTYILNDKGTVVKKYVGAREWTEEEILAEIKEAVK